MGSDLAPLFVNLFPYYYEKNRFNLIEITDIGRVTCPVSIFRFIDDLTAVNECGEFLKNLNEIYPPELELKNEHFG